MISGNGTTPYYKVQVRSTYCDPTLVPTNEGTFVIDGTWREWPVREGVSLYGVNIPVRSWDSGALRDCGLIPYAAAEAHRWALLAALEAHNLAGALCIETRLVQVDYTYSFSTTEKAATAPLKTHTREEREQFKPIEPERSGGDVVAM